MCFGCSPTGGEGAARTGDVGTTSSGAGGRAGGVGGSAGSINPIDVPKTDGGGGSAPAMPTVSKGPPPDWNCGATCFRDDIVPAGAIAGFSGPATTASQPVLVYPLAQSVHPINLGDITFQFRRADVSQTVFRIDVVGTATYSFYVPCQTLVGGAPEECVYHPHEGDWRDVTFHLRGTEATVVVLALAGASVASSAPTPIRFTSVDVAGGLYYWSTALRGTYRLLFGARKALPFITPATPAVNPFACSGCHSVSRKGNVIAFTEGELASGFLAVANTADPTQQSIRPPATGAIHDSAMMAVSPDGTRILTSYGSRLVLRDATNGQVLGSVDPSFLGTEGQGYFPEFSPDGQEIVLTLSSQAVVEWSVRNGELAILPYNGGQFGPARVIVPAGTDFHFYPTFSPDGKWVAFASAPVSGVLADASYNRSQARLRLVSREGGQVYELGRATQGVGHTSTWPKFAPFIQDNGNTLFITYNSKIDYGFALKNSTLPPAQAHPQLWFSAIDLRNLASGDPSFAPIWLPFQEVTQNNHLGYWTEVITCVTGPSSAGCDTNEQTCVAGNCVPIVR